MTSKLDIYKVIHNGPTWRPGPGYHVMSFGMHANTKNIRDMTRHHLDYLERLIDFNNGEFRIISFEVSESSVKFNTIPDGAVVLDIVEDFASFNYKLITSYL